MLYVWGCAETQRDYFQAPPAQPAGWAITGTESQDLTPQIVMALSREGYDLNPLDSIPGAIRGEIRRAQKIEAEIIAVEYDPESSSRIGVEVRMGVLGDPALEQQMADAVSAALATAPPGSGTPTPARQQWSETRLSGRWFDLEEAVARAGVSQKSVDLAVVSVDRWRFATFWDLRGLGGEEARLIVLGDRQSAAGPQIAYLRIGLFGESAREQTILKRLQDHLSELGRIKRPKETR